MGRGINDLGATPDDTLNLTKDALHAVIMETHELQIDIHEEGLQLQILGADPWFTIGRRRERYREL